MTASAAPTPPGGQEHGRHSLATLALAALGVVYGDIGTSPLYAMRECFHGAHAVAVEPGNVLGVISLVFWSLVLVVSLKYLAYIMRADNRGEGGILALMALVGTRAETGARRHYVLVLLGVFGAALLYGDGMITPAISVLSAVEGLGVATHALEPYVLWITTGILVALFLVQPQGTGRVGVVFGPIMVVWFVVLGALGVANLVDEPRVLLGLDPRHAVRFFAHEKFHAFVVLGSVFLVVTGGEALYADMGHFGRRPIRLMWFVLVLPGLLLNYLGQGALLLRDPGAAADLFYRLAPPWALYPLVFLATSATVIASQALISASFSLTRQAVQLGYSPRVEIVHTSSREIGQIYVPGVNWALMFSCIGLVWGFRSSSSLAAAYGIAVTLTMAITTVLFYAVARNLWKWSVPKAALLCLLFLVVDLAFLGANVLKIADGGWFPLVIAAAIFTLLTTWKTGRDLLSARLKEGALPLDFFLGDLESHGPLRVRGTAVFMSGTRQGVPPALLHNLKHNKVLHERNVLLTIRYEEVPYVKPAERLEVEPLEHGFVRVVGHFGFMEDPDVPALLDAAKEKGFEWKLSHTTFFLGRETVLATKRKGMALWRERLFATMTRNARSASSYFGLPPGRVVELGAQIEL